MFEEDPFDRWCRSVVELCVLVILLLESSIQQQWFRLVYSLSILGLRVRHLLFALWKRGSFLCFAFYRRFICLPLMLCGLMKVPTWAEIEAHRLQMIARTGIDVLRPAELERGLEQEQMMQQTPTEMRERRSQ